MMLNQANSSVYADATSPARLPLHQTTVIAVMLAPAGNAALIRAQSGRVKKITKGKRIDGAIVAAIDEKGVILARRGKSERLSLPDS